MSIQFFILNIIVASLRAVFISYFIMNTVFSFLALWFHFKNILINKKYIYIEDIFFPILMFSGFGLFIVMLESYGKIQIENIDDLIPNGIHQIFNLVIKFIIKIINKLHKYFIVICKIKIMSLGKKSKAHIVNTKCYNSIEILKIGGD